MNNVKKWNLPRGTTISESPEGEFVLASDYAALEAELATVKKVAYGNMELLEENQNLQAKLARLSAVPDDYLIVPIQPTEEMRKRVQDYLAAEGMIVSDWLVHTTYTEMLAAAPSAPATVQGVNAQLLESATESLDEIQAVMQEAYNSAMPVCCGRAQNECCGSPDPEWNEHDQRTMDRFALIERALRAAIAAARQEGGKV